MVEWSQDRALSPAGQAWPPHDRLARKWCTTGREKGGGTDVIAGGEWSAPLPRLNGAVSIFNAKMRFFEFQLKRKTRYGSDPDMHQWHAKWVLAVEHALFDHSCGGFSEKMLIRIVLADI
jgi:hypothetical protein